MEDTQTKEILRRLQGDRRGFLSLMKKKRVRILNIGSRHPERPLRLARAFRRMGLSPVVDFMEPSLAKRRMLLKISETDYSGHFGRIYPKTIEDAESNREYDIITALHALYESPRNRDGTISTLKKTISFLEEGGLCAFSLNTPESDFQKIREAFFPSFGKREPISISILEKSLKKDKIPYEIGTPAESIFSLNPCKNESEEALGKRMEFLFSDSLDSPPLTGEQCKTLGRWIRKNSSSASWRP